MMMNLQQDQDNPQRVIKKPKKRIASKQRFHVRLQKNDVVRKFAIATILFYAAMFFVLVMLSA